MAAQARHAIINLSAQKGRERESIIKSCHRHSRNEMMNRVWRGSNERRRKKSRLIDGSLNACQHNWRISREAWQDARRRLTMKSPMPMCKFLSLSWHLPVGSFSFDARLRPSDNDGSDADSELANWALVLISFRSILWRAKQTLRRQMKTNVLLLVIKTISTNTTEVRE